MLNGALTCIVKPTFFNYEERIFSHFRKNIANVFAGVPHLCGCMNMPTKVGTPTEQRLISQQEKLTLLISQLNQFIIQV